MYPITRSIFVRWVLANGVDDAVEAANKMGVPARTLSNWLTEE